jgi:hypothetical protein
LGPIVGKSPALIYVYKDYETTPLNEAQRACHCEGEEAQTTKQSLLSGKACFAEPVLCVVEGLALTGWLSVSSRGFVP